MRDMDQALGAYLQGLDDAHRRRRLRPLERGAELTVRIDGRDYIDFSSNDYLGLADHPDLIAGAKAYADQFGAGSRASRLVTGTLAPVAELEAAIARDKGTEAALVLVSGFQTNASVLPALLDKDVWGTMPQVFTDRLNHASMHQGIRASGLRQQRFRHNDLDHLDALLTKAVGDARKFIVTETVFSMDGDQSDVAGLAAIAERHDAVLYVDEAHATGVLGERGFGLAKGEQAQLIMGTFSKALGGFGAYVACSQAVKDLLVNRCSGLIYATALPPAVIGAMQAAWDLIPQLDAARARVARHAERARGAFRAAGLDVGGSTTQIVPVILGNTARTLALAQALESQGMLAIAIRPPTVPEGAARLRLAFSAAHSDDQVDRLIDGIIDLADNA